MFCWRISLIVYGTSISYVQRGHYFLIVVLAHLDGYIAQYHQSHYVGRLVTVLPLVVFKIFGPLCEEVCIVVACHFLLVARIDVCAGGVRDQC